MTFDGYFKTEGVGVATYSYVETTINQPVAQKVYQTLILGEKRVSYADRLFYIYMQNENDPDTSYKVLDTNASDGPEAEYISTSTSTPIYSCITGLTGGVGTIFTSDQDFGEHNMEWWVRYQAKVANVTAGYTPFIRFDFYKVATDDTETFLFSITGAVSTVYNKTRILARGYPSGTVTTDDRLLIKVYHGQNAPA